MITLDGTLGITSPAETVQGALTTTGNTILGDATTDTLNVGAGGLVKDASGNVGIGTASPAFKLEVKQTGSTTAQFERTDGVYSISLKGTGTTSGGALGMATNDMVMLTNGTERMRLDSSGNLLFNSGYGSAATAYGCRAWVNFNGTGTVAIRASGNVSSITDNGTGDYTVNFTTAMPDANYSANGMMSNDATANCFANFQTTSPLATGSCRFSVYQVNPFGTRDPVYCCITIFR